MTIRFNRLVLVRDNRTGRIFYLRPNGRSYFATPSLDRSSFMCISEARRAAKHVLVEDVTVTITTLEESETLLAMES